MKQPTHEQSGGAALERSVENKSWGLNQHETSPLILMQVKITNICSVHMGSSTWSMNNYSETQIIIITMMKQSNSFNGDLKQEYKKATNGTMVGLITNTDSLAPGYFH